MNHQQLNTSVDPKEQRRMPPVAAELGVGEKVIEGSRSQQASPSRTSSSKKNIAHALSVSGKYLRGRHI